MMLMVPLVTLTAQDQLLSVNSLHNLYISSDGGLTWTTMDVLPSINRSVYLTASARHQTKSGLIVVGTSFEGIYESRDGGKKWSFLSDSRIFRQLHQGAGFYDEVIALAYARDESEDIIFRIGYNGKSYRFLRAKKTVVEIQPDTAEYAWLPSEFRWSFDLHTGLPSWHYTLPVFDPTRPLPPGWNQINSPPQFTADEIAERIRRRTIASEKRGIYLNANQASSRSLPGHLDFIAKNGMNSLVVDFKDDMGLLTYDSKVPLAIENKAVLKRFDAEALIKAAHDKGIYVIARIVVFKDKQLFRYDRNNLAIWDRVNARPWGVFRQEEVPGIKEGDPPTNQWVQTEYWVDPYSDKVRQYNIAIAMEAQSLGVDEIQFDYIRFPSDGNTANMIFRHHLDNQGKQIKDETMADRVRVLTQFLKEAREAVNIPIGTDVFGFNGWARMSYLGQDIQAFSYYVDVISPMAYPSHYARDFLGSMNYFDRASHIYQVGTERSRFLIGDRALIRPYVQAFLLGGELNFSDPQYFDYLNRQVKSSYLGGGSGFTLWNNSGRYYMVDQNNFKKLFEGK